MPVVDLSKLPANAMATTPLQEPIKEDFKTFKMNIPKIEGIEFERQRDYPSTQLR